MKPECIVCGDNLALLRDLHSHYTWQCRSGCAPTIDTGVDVSEEIAAFERVGIVDGMLNIPIIAGPTETIHSAGVKVYMPYVLYHFIACQWGGCYNSLYANVIVPLLDSPSVVDYVLKSSAIHDTPDVMVGSTGARIYPELMFRLRNVRSPAIHRYLQQTFNENVNNDTKSSESR